MNSLNRNILIATTLAVVSGMIMNYFEMNNEGSWHELRENQHLLHDYLIKKMKKSR